jgi:ribosome maturation factor RimP
MEMSEAVESEIERLVAPALDAMGFTLVRVKVTGLGGERRTLQIMAERGSDGGITVDDCAAISRAVSALLDVEDPIHGHYTLEVSSPGLDRPLVHERDFERFAGFEARVETRQPIDGRRRFRGQLAGISGGKVCIVLGADKVHIPFTEISAAKLVLTDELLAAAQQQRHV